MAHENNKGGVGGCEFTVAFRELLFDCATRRRARAAGTLGRTHEERAWAGAAPVRGGDEQGRAAGTIGRTHDELHVSMQRPNPCNVDMQSPKCMQS